MLNSLRNKIIIPSLGVLLLLVLVIVVFVTVSTTNMATELTKDRMDAAASMVHTYIDSLTTRVRVTASAESTSQVLVTALDNWNNDIDREENRLALYRYFSGRMNDLGLSGAVIFDREGNIMLRTHDFNHFGDNLRHLPQASAALDRGETSAFFFSTPAQPMGQTVAVPIWHGDEVIGVLSASYFLHTNEFVDRLGRGFNAEITIFAGAERVATTIRDAAGNREVGINAPDEVIETVINRGQPFMDAIILGGAEFNVYYFPLLNLAGTPEGMFFVGFSNENTNQATSEVQRNLIIIGIAGIIAAAIVMLILITGSLKPLGRLTRIVKDVSAGNVNINVDHSRITKDEIGALTTDVLGLVDVVKNMVEDLVKAHHEYIEVGNIHYSIDTSKYQNSYTEMIGLVNNLLTAVTGDINKAAATLSNVADGNFDKKMNSDSWVGEWIVMPNAINKLIENLQSVGSEITSMINAVSTKGDLTFQIDAAKYNNDWRKIMDGLNSITKAVNSPLQVMNLALIEMSNGNVNLADIDKKIIAQGHRVEKELFSGIFYDCIVAFKNSFTQMQSYVDEIAEKLLLLSHGELNVTITNEYLGSFASIKDSFNAIATTLNKTMSEISSAADQVLSGAKQISASAADLANGAQEQASSVQELNATIDVVNQQTHQNAANATTASELSSNTAANAQQGNASMKEMLAAMSQIKESSGEISKVIKAIENITFQTNLLALNASVEAARAGDHGKGFGVVADEVRSLAGHSATSAAETNSLIATSISRVESGSEIAESTAVSLDMIVSNVNEVSSIINNIATSSQEQAEAIAQISEGLSQISRVTQSNSAVSEETAAASEELNSQAEVLQQLVSYFKLK